jgi:hypothetical protein
MSVTFVSSFIKVYEPQSDKSNEWRINHFRKMAALGIRILLFISPDVKSIIQELCVEYPNIRIMHVLTIQETPYWTMWKDQSLPKTRNINKDTMEFLCLMNSKTEFLKHAIRENPWNTDYFAWIDFSLPYVFKTEDTTLQRIKYIGNHMDFAGRRFLSNAGCWDHQDSCYESLLTTQSICWRFCGGFLVGDKESILNFMERAWECASRLPPTWEVNVWAITEYYDTSLSPIQWYKADHDDSIVLNFPIGNLSTVSHTSLGLQAELLRIGNTQLSPFVGEPPIFSQTSLGLQAELLRIEKAPDGRFFSQQSIANQLPTETCNTTIEFPTIIGYNPSAISYGNGIINCRYVNYSIDETTGIYKFPAGHLDGILRSINLMAHTDASMKPLSGFTKMGERSLGLERRPATFSKGIEDIRLWFDSSGQRRFIGSTSEYSIKGVLQMVIGKYELYGDLIEGKIIESPCELEKNWIPLPDGETIIYKWNPFTLGKIVGNKIQLEPPLGNTSAYELRGSTTFSKCGEGQWLGLVHFSVNVKESIRAYYHMFVFIGDDWIPIKFSRPFYFGETAKIEFCTGLSVLSNDVYLWTTRFDRNPQLRRVSLSTVYSLCA